MIKNFRVKTFDPNFKQNTYRNKVNQMKKNIQHTNWSKSEQSIIFEKFKQHNLKWKTIAKSVQNRSENSVKSFFYSSIRKIKKLKNLKILKLMICFPTFRNNSKNFIIFLFSF